MLMEERRGEKSLRTAGLEVLHDSRELFFYLLKSLNPLRFTLVDHSSPFSHRIESYNGLG